MGQTCSFSVGWLLGWSIEKIIWTCTQAECFMHVCACRLLVVLWLFWETYFATVGSVVKVSNWVSAVLQKWQYKRKWGAKAAGRSRQ